MANGKQMQAEIFDKDGSEAAAVIALTPDMRVIIARQFRCGPERIFDELPGGIVNAGESPKEAALRELEEETGYEAGRVEYLGKVYKHAWMAMSFNYYIAYDCIPSGRGSSQDKFEDIEVDEISISQLIDNARNTKMSDTEAVFLAYETLKKLEEEA